MTQQKSKKKMAERRAQRRRQSQVRLIVGIIIAAVVLVGAIVVLSLQPSEQPREDVAGAYNGIPQEIDRTSAVGLAIGEADAPVTVVEYSDFSCSHCKTLAATMIDLVEKYARDGRLRVVYKPVAFVNPPYSRPAAQAAICAAEQGMGWQMMDHIWGLNSPTVYSLNNFITIDESIGLDIDQFKQCYSASDTRRAVDGVLDETQAKGIAGTPTVFVNGVLVDYSQAASIGEAVAQAVEAVLEN